MIKRLLLTLFVALIGIAATAQTDAVRWRLSVKMTSETEGVITLRALVGEGWHMYGTQLPDGGPRPTKISFDGSQGITPVGKLTPSVAPVTVNDPMFGLKLNWWAQNVNFTQKFKLNKPEGAKVVANVTYMACDNKNCTPPKSQTLTYNFK